MSNNNELAEKFGFSKNYFYVLKTVNKPAYDWFFSFDEDQTASITKAIDSVRELKAQVEDIVYELDEVVGAKRRLATLMKDNSQLSSVSSIYKIFANIFAEVNNSWHRKYHIYKNIIKTYQDNRDDILSLNIVWKMKKCLDTSKKYNVDLTFEDAISFLNKIITSNENNQLEHSIDEIIKERIDNERD